MKVARKFISPIKTVGELREALSQFDQNLPIIACNEDEDAFDEKSMEVQLWIDRDTSTPVYVLVDMIWNMELEEVK